MNRVEGEINENIGLFVTLLKFYYLKKKKGIIDFQVWERVIREVDYF